jgi:hypothetical protein
MMVMVLVVVIVIIMIIMVMIVTVTVMIVMYLHTSQKDYMNSFYASLFSAALARAAERVETPGPVRVVVVAGLESSCASRPLACSFASAI